MSLNSSLITLDYKLQLIHADVNILSYNRIQIKNEFGENQKKSMPVNVVIGKCDFFQF